MKVFFCDACGHETDETKLRTLHTHGPMPYYAATSSITLTFPANYERWEICPSCYDRTTEGLGWYRAYRAKRAAEEVKS